ncbi:MAG TPA: hypothetical protein VGJ15_06235, partial [Pirellulales bacterium]
MGLLLKALSQNSPPSADDALAQEDDPKKTIPRKINRPKSIVIQPLDQIPPAELAQPEGLADETAVSETAKISLPADDFRSNFSSPPTVHILRPIAATFAQTPVVAPDAMQDSQAVKSTDSVKVKVEQSELGPVENSDQLSVEPSYSIPTEQPHAPDLIEPAPPLEESDADVLAHRLEELNELIADEIAGIPPVLAISPAAAPMPAPTSPLSAPAGIAPIAAPTASSVIAQLPPPASFEPPLLSAPIPALQLRREYQELCDHLLTRISLTDRPTLLFADAGRAVQEAAWLVPLAHCLSEWRNQTQPASNSALAYTNGAKSQSARPLSSSGAAQILIVEAAGPACGISAMLGLTPRPGLGELLDGRVDWKDVVQPTAQANIYLLAHG